MRNYFIVRRGSNRANQSMQEISILGIARGKNCAKKTTELISHNKTDYTCYSNQYILILTHKEAKKIFGVRDIYKNILGERFEDSDICEGFMVPVED